MHWCRVLPQSALVVELHGALKHDLGENDLFMYANLCAIDMGLRWVGVPVQGALPTVRRAQPDADNPLEWGKWKHPRENDVWEARVDPETLVATLQRALQGDWLSAFLAYASGTSVGLREHMLERTLEFQRQRLLALPQYAS
eukprot:5818927-Prymnesium_polylepis.2